MEKPWCSQSRAWSVSPAVLALAVGLAGWGAAALAGEPIPGVDVELGKNPGGIAVSAPTNKDGTYQFTGLAPGRYDLSVAGQRVQTITVGTNRSIRGSLTRNDDGAASVTIGDRKPVVLRGLVTIAVTVTDDGRDGKKRTADPAQDGGDVPGKKHNYKGVVTLVRGTAPRPGEGKPDGPPRVMDEANSAMGQVSTTRGRLERPDQALQPGIAVFTLPPTYLPDAPFRAALRPNAGDKTLPGLVGNDRAPSPDAVSSGNGEARTFEVRVQPVNDPPSKVATGIPSSVDSGGPPVTVLLRNVDTGALARTMPNPANGELAFTDLQAANYVVEIVDAAGKIVGTSPSLSVAAGGRLSGRLGQSERGGGIGAFFGSTGVPIRQNASADGSVRTAAAGDVAVSPVGGFGKGMAGSPGFGPDVGRMNGPGPGMMSPPGPGPGAPAMSGPMGMGGRAGGAMGGAMGRP